MVMVGCGSEDRGADGDFDDEGHGGNGGVLKMEFCHS